MKLQKEQKICRIVGAGEPSRLFKPLPGEIIIAADGGLSALSAASIVPDYTIGDFDSINIPLKNTGEIVKLNSEKDDTDLLAAVRLGLEKGCTEFYIYRAAGGRLSHTIANIQCLKYLVSNGYSARIITADGFITVIPPGEILDVQEAGYVSVFALDNQCCGVNLEGFKYPLKEYSMSDLFPIGVSNELSSEKPGRISCKTGFLLVITENKK